MRILITGATGRVGHHVVRHLADHHTVTAVARTSATRLPDGVTWRAADLADPEPWPALLKDVDAALLFPAFGHTHHFIDAAKAADLQKLVILSSMAVSDLDDSAIKAAHAKIEEQAAKADILTHRVRPTVFMANDLAWLSAIKRGTPVPLAHPFAAMPAIAEQDIAAVIASCLTRDIHGITHEITGPQTLTQLERLHMLTEAATGARSKWTDITADAERHGLPHMPGPPGHYLLRNLALASEEPVQPTSHVEDLLGREGLDYATWARTSALP